MATAPNHPQFDALHPMPTGDVVAAFKVGHYMKPPAEVLAAAERVRAAIEALADDLKTIRPWNGSVAYYAPSAQMVNPVITESMEADFVMATLEANPGWYVVSSWPNSSHGLEGLSVRIRIKNRG